MSEHAATEHAAHPPAAGEGPFSAADRANFIADDKTAAGAIVTEMGGIFILGLILYSIVALVVADVL